MMMTTIFQLTDEVNVQPTQGLDVGRGLVRIVAVMCYEDLPRYIDGEKYLCGEDKYDDETRGSAWYAFRYLDENLHKMWDVCYLPEMLFMEIVQES